MTHRYMKSKVIILSVVIGLFSTSCYKLPLPIDRNDQHSEHILPLAKDTCDSLRDQIQQINSHSTVVMLDQINFHITQCLPHLAMDDRVLLLYASTAMYQRFLSADMNRTSEQEANFQKLLSNTDIYSPTRIQQAARTSLRDQYLLKYQGQSYYEIYNAGGHEWTYRRKPDYLKDIFAPFLPKAEQIFITHLAEQNQQPAVSDNTFNLSWSEIANRAQFWENYTSTYPNSMFIEDARRLQLAYAGFLFHGLANMPISTNYENEDSIHPEALQEIKAIAANQSQSVLTQQAIKFLKFIHLPLSERNQNIPVTLSPVETRAKSQQNIKNMRQLDQYIGLYDPLALDSTHINRDCFSDSICVTHIGGVTSVSPQK